MKTAIKSKDALHEAIIDSLPLLDAAHRSKRADFFAKGLPFYTCIDSEKNIWRKETKNGKTVYVTFEGFESGTYSDIEKLVPNYCE